MCCFASGWIAALTGLNTSIPVGIIMLLIAALFTALSVGSLIMFKKVKHSFQSAMHRTVRIFKGRPVCQGTNNKTNHFYMTSA